MNRRNALKTIAFTGVAAMFPKSVFASVKQKKHIVTLSFDDGFKQSSMKTAEIFEKHGLRACINVIAGRTGYDNIIPPDEWHRHPVGNWDYWNELQSRGHEIMPHGLVHADLSELPLTVAQNMITTCLNIFTEKLNGFDPQKSVFNFPYNRSTYEIEEWLKTRVMAFRTSGPGVNPMPFKGQKRLGCLTSEEGNIDEHLNQAVDDLLKLDEGWLIYNTHGVDDEGWGPVSATALDKLLDRLKNTPSVEIASTAQLLRKVNKI